MSEDQGMESSPDPAGRQKKRRVKKKRRPTFPRTNLVDDFTRSFNAKRRSLLLLLLAAGITVVALLAVFLIYLLVRPSQAVPAPYAMGQSSPSPAPVENFPHLPSTSAPGPSAGMEAPAADTREKLPGSFHGNTADSSMEIKPDFSDQEPPLKGDELKKIKIFDVTLSTSRKDQSSVVAIHGSLRSGLSRNVERLVLIVDFIDQTAAVVAVKRFGLANITAAPDTTLSFDKVVEVKSLPPGFKYQIEAVDGYYVIQGEQPPP